MPITAETLKQFDTSRAFIETGLDRGDGVRAALAAGFRRIVSIELSQDSVDVCEEAFVGKPVTLLQGDTVVQLKALLTSLFEPAVFWLDAHPNDSSPILEELAALKNHHIKTHTILIDDRRLMQGDTWKNVHEIQVLQALKDINPNYKIWYVDGHVPEDIIVAVAP
jgi:hypothetical protein